MKFPYLTTYLDNLYEERKKHVTTLGMLGAFKKIKKEQQNSSIVNLDF